MLRHLKGDTGGLVGPMSDMYPCHCPAKNEDAAKGRSAFEDN